MTTRLTHDRGQLVLFTAGANAGVAVEQKAFRKQSNFDFCHPMAAISDGENPVENLPGNIGGTVVTAADIDGAAIAGAHRCLAETKLTSTSPSDPASTFFRRSVPTISVGATVGDQVVPLSAGRVAYGKDLHVRIVCRCF